MDPVAFDTHFRVFTVLAVIAGLALIGFESPALTVVGIVLVILSAVSLLVVVRNAMAEQPAA